MRNKLRTALRDVRTHATIISLFLSAWGVFLDDVINDDGILYLRAADLLVHGEWGTAFNLYQWPFYSLLIAITGQVTGFSLEYSAHLLNAVLAALVIACFISLVREVGGDSKTVLAAALVVLLYPGINEYRSFINRDIGYIAFYLFSLLFFFKHLKSPRLAYAIGWTSSMFVAALFRIEGFVFLLILPLLEQWRKAATLPARLMLMPMISVACFALVLILAWWFSSVNIGSDRANILHGVSILLESLWQNIVSGVSAKLTVISEQFLNAYSREHVYVIYFSTAGTILLVESLARLTPLYAFLTGHAIYRKLIFPVDGIKYFWTWLVFLNLAILGVFVVVKLFLTGRFPLALSLTLMLAVPFSLIALYEKWQENRTKPIRTNWIFPTVVILFLLMAVDGLYSPTNKTYLKEAGIWLTDNTPAQSTLLTNNQTLMFYAARNVYSDAGRFLPSHELDFIKNKEWQQYDYLAIRIKSEKKKQTTSLVGTLSRDPVIRFANSEGDEVLIFKVH
ncbi:MAG: hypothetical protein ACE5FE_00500 [Acidiferrobacterales bacterium]